MLPCSFRSLLQHALIEGKSEPQQVHSNEVQVANGELALTPCLTPAGWRSQGSALRNSPRTSTKGKGVETPDFWISSTFLALEASSGDLRLSLGHRLTLTARSRFCSVCVSGAFMEPTLLTCSLDVAPRIPVP